MIDYDDILENGKLTTDDKAFHVDNITLLCMHLNSNIRSCNHVGFLRGSALIFT